MSGITGTERCVVSTGTFCLADWGHSDHGLWRNNHHNCHSMRWETRHANYTNLNYIYFRFTEKERNHL